MLYIDNLFIAVCRTYGRRKDGCIHQEVRNTPKRDSQLDHAHRLCSSHHGPDHVRSERGQSFTTVVAP